MVSSKQLPVPSVHQQVLHSAESADTRRTAVRRSGRSAATWTAFAQVERSQRRNQSWLGETQKQEGCRRLVLFKRVKWHRSQASVETQTVINKKIKLSQCRRVFFSAAYHHLTSCLQRAGCDSLSQALPLWLCSGMNWRTRGSVWVDTEALTVGGWDLLTVL